MSAETVGERLQQLRSTRSKILTEMDAKDILRIAGLNVPEVRLVDSEKLAVEACESLGYPVVLKVHSSAISHKSDVGGVKLNLADSESVAGAFREIVTSCSEIDPNAQVLVQRMFPPGIEAIIGVSRDAQFGPVIMFGLGGVFTELFQDVVFRLIPITLQQAHEMIMSIHGSALLKGYRGKPGGDIDSLAKMILQVSDLVNDHPEIKELDINPVLVYPHSAVVVDARMVLNGGE